jgi:ketosteroid isomerase-like protein
VCRRFVDAYRPDRLDDLLALLHPDIEWATTETWVEREVWYGHAGVRAGLRRFYAEWEDFSNDEVEVVSDGGDKFALVTRMRGRSRGTRIPTEMRTSGVLEVRDGLIVRVVGHSDPADARGCGEVCGGVPAPNGALLPEFVAASARSLPLLAFRSPRLSAGAALAQRGRDPWRTSVLARAGARDPARIGEWSTPEGDAGARRAADLSSTASSGIFRFG